MNYKIIQHFNQKYILKKMKSHKINITFKKVFNKKINLNIMKQIKNKFLYNLLKTIFTPNELI